MASQLAAFAYQRQAEHVLVFDVDEQKDNHPKAEKKELKDYVSFSVFSIPANLNNLSFLDSSAFPGSSPVIDDHTPPPDSATGSYDAV